MRVAWFSSGCSSFVAAYYGKPDRIVYIDVANQHPDSMRFLRDAEKVLGREIEIIKPTKYTFDDLSRKFGWDDYEEYGDTRYAADKYDKEFDFLGWHFHFWGDDNDDTPRYGATMSRDGETWECDYDCMFGAGFDDIH